MNELESGRNQNEFEGHIQEGDEDQQDQFGDNRRRQTALPFIQRVFR